METLDNQTGIQTNIHKGMKRDFQKSLFLLKPNPSPKTLILHTQTIATLHHFSDDIF